MIDDVSAEWLTDPKSGEICGLRIPLEISLVSKFKISDDVRLTAECKIVEITENTISIKWISSPSIIFNNDNIKN